MTPGQTSPVILIRRDLAGRPRDWLLFLAMVGAVVLAGRAMDAFPLLDPDVFTSYLVGGVTFVGALTVLARARRKLIPWGSQAPLLMWGGLAGFAAAIAVSAWGLVSFGNGALDRAPPNHVRFTVVGRTKYRSSFFLRVERDVHSVASRRSTYSVEVREEDWDSGGKGSSLLVDVKPGFFRMPWVAGYRLCRGREGSC